MATTTSTKLTEQSPLWLRNFVSGYQSLTVNNLDLLESIYHQDVTFIDPLHKVEGFAALEQYFTHLYQHLSSCEFVINSIISEEHEAAIYWQMSYRHPRLNKGEMVRVCGSSHIKGEQDKVIYHRDYLDLGAMLYEQLPFFGRLIKWIKSKAAN